MSSKKPLSEKDLRLALEEFAGNPVADAERVLSALQHEALPQTALSQKGARRLSFGPVAASAAAMVAGFFVGFLIWGTGSAGTPSDEDPNFLSKQERGMRPAFAFEESGPQLLVSFGSVTIKKKDSEAWPCPTGVGLPMNTILSTGPDGQAFLRMEDGSDIILDSNCELQLISLKVLFLKRGEIWARLVKGEGDYIFRSPQGRILIVPENDSGEAVHDIKAENKSLRVVSLRGSCRLESRNGKTLEVLAGFKGLIIRDELDKARKIPFLSDYGEWRRRLLAFRDVAPEIHKLQQECPKLILMLGDPDQWRTVDLKFRKMEIKGIEYLFDFLLNDKDAKNYERRAHAAGLISITADIRFLDKLFKLLLHEESNIRVRAYYALERLLGFTYETEPGFWERDDRAAQQKKAMSGWLEIAMKERPPFGYLR